MIKIYYYMPGWTVPCISPHCTKSMFYMTMAGLKYEAIGQDLSRLDVDSPYGMLPRIVDEDGTVVVDSTDIVHYLENKHGNPLNRGATPAELGQMLAWDRTIHDHTYWVAVIEPRWRETPNWEIYIRIILGVDPSADLALADRLPIDDFRYRVLKGFNELRWGRMPREAVYERARGDIDAMSGFLGNKPFFMGAEPRSIDATVLSILRHTIDTPFTFDTKEYASKKSNLVEYMGRMKERFGI